jgi:hypothetical protein
MEEENSNYFTQAHTDTYSSNASNEVPAKWSGYQIPSAIVVFIILVFKVYFVSLIPRRHKMPWTD